MGLFLGHTAIIVVRYRSLCFHSGRVVQNVCLSYFRFIFKYVYKLHLSSVVYTVQKLFCFSSLLLPTS
jgi:hypothetical protein